MISEALIKFWSKFQIQILWYSFTRDDILLLTLFQSPSWKIFPERSRHMNNSLGVYLFLNSELKLGKSKIFNTQRMKVQVKRVFVFFLTKNKQTNKQTLHDIFFNPPITTLVLQD